MPSVVNTPSETNYFQTRCNRQVNGCERDDDNRRTYNGGFRRLLVRYVLAAALTVCAISFCHAQQQQDTTAQRGFNPGGSYSISDIESVSTTNGNVGLQIPIASLPAGRGGFAGAGLRLIYNSKVWDVPISIVPDGTYNQAGVPMGRPQHYLKASTEGGWRYGAGYEVRLINHLDEYGDSPIKPSCESQYGTSSHDADYIYKVQVIFPDGSAHDFVPQGYQSAANTTGNGYYNIRPDGYLTGCSCTLTPMGPSCTEPTFLNNAGTMTYYSTDGTYTRLDVTHDSDSNQWNNPWTMYMPDGTRVVGTGFTGVGSSLQPGYPGSERVYDRNNNYVDIQITLNLISITDQFGRSITVNRSTTPSVDYINVTGFGGTPLTWTVRWKYVYVSKSYNTADIFAGCTASMSCNSNLTWTLAVIDGIDLPSQAGGLSYTFGYNGNSTPNGQSTPPSPGWGELSSVTLPSGATASYAYREDNQNNITWYAALQNYPTSRSLNYLREYDGSSTPVTETWSYAFNFNYGSSTSYQTTVTSPAGGTTSDSIKYTGSSPPAFDDGLSFKTTRPDGTVIERLWASNMPYGHYGPWGNPYIKTEFASIPDANGNPTKTAIKDFDYDKNGNLTRVSEYDWMDYASVPRGPDGKPTGIPSGVQPKKVTLNTYNAPTQNASDTNLTNSPNSYSKGTSPSLRSAVATSEVSGDVGGTLSRAEFYYDNPSTTGNLTEQRVWDSTKGALSRPLTAANWISVTHQYDAYGNLTLTTDGRGYQTQTVYGAVASFSDLYPTQVKAANGTTVQRTTNQEYDFYTGLVTRVTDADNNVSTSTIYDVFGRPTLVVAAENKPEETRTTTVYSDVNRRVIVRSDMNSAGDGKLVSIQHYDQLGRVRLTRTLEDSSAQSETDETTGIKVQTRYAYGNLSTDPYIYTLVSNPYRAATSAAASAESTMGWTRGKVDKAGRAVETQTFAGASLPAPWGSNTAGTGSVTTAYDSQYTTVTDQAGRPRRSATDGLGRLVRVDEPDGSFNLGSTTSPVQPTAYAYDALGNLRQVTQGSQYRYFMYDSLSRLTRTKSPEQAVNGGITGTDPITGNAQWSISYGYDNDGDLTSRTDARGVAAAYIYDALDRNTSINYSGGGTSPFTVNHYYDGATNGKGRLWWTETVGVAATAFDSYDALGKPKQYHQIYWVNGAWGQQYNVSRIYDKAGHVLTQTYPSGHTVTYNYDAAGRLGDSGTQQNQLAFTGNLGDGVQRTYATQVSYSTFGGIQQEQFGTQTALFRKLHYNVRGQLYDQRLSKLSWATDQWDWSGGGAFINFYSTAEINAATNEARANSGPDNNGNLRQEDTFVQTDPNGTYNASTAGAYFVTVQGYGYDSINRLTSVSETNYNTALGAWGTPLSQGYHYDQWGNRTIDANQTSGAPNTQFTVDATTNRLGVPTGQSGAMGYDAAGNLTLDSYTGPGNGSRTYDGENRMVTAADSYGGTSTYTYDGDGHRIKRANMYGETWQVYGIGGELLAEYQSGAAPFVPTKEYGYRGGELLVTMSSGDPQRMTRFVKNLYYNCLARDPLSSELQQQTNALAQAGAQGGESQLLTVAKSAARTLFQSSEYAARGRSNSDYVTDLYNAYLQRAPDTSGLNFWVQDVQNNGRDHTLTAFEVSTEFATMAETVYGTTSAGDNQRVDHFIDEFYLGAYNTFPASGDKQTWEQQLNSAAAVSESQVISEAQTMGAQIFQATNYNSSQTDQQYVTALYEAFLQRAPDGPGLNFWAQDAHNNGRAHTLAAFQQSTEYQALAGTLYRETFWLVSDHLGTPRIVADKSGSLSGIKRHDYLPFGEELSAGTGGRTTTQGYGASDDVRQKFTGSERDVESSLDYMQARYFSSVQGRFTSTDPLPSSGKLLIPQSLNRYTYAINNPLTYTDPTGLDWYINEQTREVHWYTPGNQPSGFTSFTPTNNQYNISDTQSVILDPHGPNPNGKTEEERQGWSYGPHIDDSSGASKYVVAAGVVTVAQPEGPGEAADVPLLIVALALWATHETVPTALPPPSVSPSDFNEQPPPMTMPAPAIDPNIYSGNDRGKIAKIASDTGLTPEQVSDAIHEIKKGYFGDTNPDVNVDKHGEVTLPGGEYVGNIRDYVSGDTGERGSKHGRGSRNKW